MQPETEELIKTWYGLATRNNLGEGNPHDTYSQFMALWVAFNALYNSRRSSIGKEDWEQIDKFASEVQAKARHTQLLRDDVEYRKAVFFLKENGVYKVRNERSLKATLTAIRKIRNNLFHGRKIPGDLEDEGLVKASHKIISELMLIEPYLSRS